VRIWYVPIEPLGERYTASWYVNIDKYFRSKSADVFRIDGIPLSQNVEVGTFLDINSTVHYKSSQLSVIASLFAAKEVRNHDVFFFGDLEFWGLESVQLMAQMNKVDVKIYGFLHAASYTREDAFSIAEPYQKYTEVGWVEAVDKIFVGSAYHKTQLFNMRVGPISQLSIFSSKIIVTGNPMFREDYKEYPDVVKDNTLILPNRFDYEKRPNISLDFAYILKRRNPSLRIMVTTSRPKFTSNRQWLVQYARRLEADGVIEIHAGLTKEQYHRCLSEAKVMLSNTIEENFGYCIAEACHYGCIPIIQNAFSHPELVQYDDRLLFNSEDEIIQKVEDVLYDKMGPGPHFSSKGKEVQSYAEPFFHSMDRIYREMNDARSGE
jgi:glycosyltransferase involved in cell wall biosynthesis